MWNNRLPHTCRSFDAGYLKALIATGDRKRQPRNTPGGPQVVDPVDVSNGARTFHKTMCKGEEVIPVGFLQVEVHSIAINCKQLLICLYIYIYIQ